MKATKAPLLYRVKRLQRLGGSLRDITNSEFNIALIYGLILSFGILKQLLLPQFIFELASLVIELGDKTRIYYYGTVQVRRVGLRASWTVSVLSLCAWSVELHLNVSRTFVGRVQLSSSSHSGIFFEWCAEYLVDIPRWKGFWITWLVHLGRDQLTQLCILQLGADF